MTGPKEYSPLAERMRPRAIEEFVGQEQLVREGKLLRQLMRERYLPSLILWGPPGSGKTTLAHLLARASGADFVFFSAVLSGVKEIRQIIDQARERQQETQAATVLFVDEIHRFNKSQQDAFLPHVESGLIILIGATTENPSFQVIAPLLSRCRVIVLEPLARHDLGLIIDRALRDRDRGLGSRELEMETAAREHLINMADGDARNALNSLEIAASIAPVGPDGRPVISLAIVEEAIQRKSLRYDAAGEEHYNLISALHKSLRDSDPDGALYWLGRMLAAGEEPLYLARRLIRFASEDIGNADPQALTVALNTRESYHMLGSPEGELALAQAVIYLATAPKSNAVYSAYRQVMRDIKRTGSLPVPLHIRNAPTRLMKEIGYGHGYRYAHDEEEALVPQEHLPPELREASYYRPTTRGYEAVISDRLHKWREILKRKKAAADKAEKKGESPK
jgi:putative ATPase